MKALWLMRRGTKTLYRLKGTGLPRLAERIRCRVARKARCCGTGAEIWISDFCGNLRFCCDLSEHMGSQIFFKGGYSRGQLVLLRELLNRDSVFVDVGANQGEFTVCAAALVPYGHVFAFEPVPDLRVRLERNISANDFSNVEVLSVGLSNNTKNNVPIYGADVVFEDGTEHIGLPTLFDLGGRKKLLGRIDLRCLDDVLPEGQRVDVMKVDVEGAEMAVFKGAEQTICREKPAIIFEASTETSQAAGYSVKELGDWLCAHGYDLAIIGDDGHLRPVNGGQDLISLKFSNVLARHRTR